MTRRILPLATLATGLLGTLAAVGWGYPLGVSWLGLGLVVAGVVGVEEGRDGA